MLDWEKLAETEFYAGHLDEAIPYIRKAVELNPGIWISPIVLSTVYLMQGRPQDALQESEHIQPDAFRIRTRAMAYYALGQKKESDTALRELIKKYHASAAFSIGMVYAYRNQRDEAFEWLDRAYSQRDGGLVETKLNSLLKNLHGDPSYTVLLEKLHLPA